MKTFNATLSDVQAVTSELRERKAIIADAQKAIQSIDGTAQSITDLSNSAKDVVNRRSSLDQGQPQRRRRGDQGRRQGRAHHDLRPAGPDQRLRHHRLAAAFAAIVTLQSAAESLDRLSSQVEQNPRGLVGKAPAKQIEVKP
jgi:phospholipid/cholesterol/gamma-HCH transport system substrate-binding protein